MNKRVRLMSAAGVGAGLMYMFDPVRGKRRRALVRNKMRHAAKVAGDVAGRTGRDVRNHLRGVMAEVGTLFRTRDVSDDVVKARIRAKLGRVVSHPSTIEVKSFNGSIILSGPILAGEEHPLLESVAGIHGVKNIENLLKSVKTSGHGREDEGVVINAPNAVNVHSPGEGVFDFISPPEEFADVVSHAHETRCNMFMR